MSNAGCRGWNTPTPDVQEPRLCGLHALSTQHLNSMQCRQIAAACPQCLAANGRPVRHDHYSIGR